MSAENLIHSSVTDARHVWLCCICGCASVNAWKGSVNPQPLLFARSCDLRLGFRVACLLTKRKKGVPLLSPCTSSFRFLSVACARIDATHQLHLLALTHTHTHTRHLAGTRTKHLPTCVSSEPMCSKCTQGIRLHANISVDTQICTLSAYTQTRTNVRFHRDHLFGNLLPERALNATARGTQQLFGKLRQTFAVNRLTCTRVMQ